MGLFWWFPFPSEIKGVGWEDVPYFLGLAGLGAISGPTGHRGPLSPHPNAPPVPETPHYFHLPAPICCLYTIPPPSPTPPFPSWSLWALLSPRSSSFPKRQPGKESQAFELSIGPRESQVGAELMFPFFAREEPGLRTRGEERSTFSVVSAPLSPGYVEGSSARVTAGHGAGRAVPGQESLPRPRQPLCRNGLFKKIVW